MSQVDPAFYASGVVIPGPSSLPGSAGQFGTWGTSGAFVAWVGSWDLTTLTLPKTTVETLLFAKSKFRHILPTDPQTVTLAESYSTQYLTLSQVDANVNYRELAVGLGANAYGVETLILKSRSTDGVTRATVVTGDEIWAIVAAVDNGTSSAYTSTLFIAVDDPAVSTAGGTRTRLAFRQTHYYPGDPVTGTGVVWQIRGDNVMQLGGQNRYAQFDAAQFGGGLAIKNVFSDPPTASFTSIGSGTFPGELRLLEGSASGTNYVGLKSPTTLAGNVTYTLPTADGSSGQVLSTSGTGTLSWATAGSGSVATDSIWNTKGDLAVGTGADTAALLVASTNGFVLSCDSAEATGLKWIAAPGGGDMLLGTSQVVTALKTFGAAGAVGKFAIAGTTSGSTIVDATAAASGTLTLPAATDTLVGKATTDTLTNKTFDTAGTGNSLSINSVAVTANTGTGAVARATSPTFVTPVLGVASATSLATSAASPLLLTNGQLATIALTSQTVGATTLTIPDFASVVDEFVFKTKSVTMSNKTFVAPVLGAALATSINKVALTAPATSCTLTIADGATLTVSASATISSGTHSGTNTGDQTSVSGNAGTVTVADAGGDTTTWVLLGTSQTGSLAPATDAGLTYNATTDALTATTFVGALTGNASGSSGSCTGNSATVTTNANLTGHVTSTGNAAILGSFTIAQLNTAVSDANLQPEDATLTAFAALTIAAESLTIGTGADAFTQVTFAANTFPARSSSGSLVAKSITDAALTVLDDTTVSAMVDTLGGASATGTGGIVRATAPTLVTPVLGDATATTLNGLTVTTTTGTLTLVNGSTLVTAGAFSNTLTTTGATNVTLPTTGTLATLAGTETLTNKRVTPRVTTQTDGASITPNTDGYDILYYTSATQSGTLTINADVGAPTNGQKWILKTKATNSLTFAWNAQLIGSTDLALPTVTTAAKVDYFGFIWDAVGSKWNLVAKTQGF